MKKYLALVLVLAVACMCLVGCGGAGDFEGKWECESVSVSGVTLDDSSLPLGPMLQLEVDDNGKATMTSNSTGRSSKATVEWEVSGETLTLSPDNSPVRFRLKDGKISTTITQGTQTMKFTLKKVNSFSKYNEEDMQKALAALSGKN